MKLRIHKIEWHSNEKTGSPVIFAGEHPTCGEYRWTVGSKKWRHMTCEKCLAIRKKDKQEKLFR